MGAIVKRMQRRWLLPAGLLVIGLVMSAPAALARSEPGGVIVTEHYVLSSGQTYRGNLVVLAHDVTLEPGSRVLGNVTIYANGSVSLRGEIDGSLQMLGGQVIFGEGFQGNGNIWVCSSNIQRPDTGIQINGKYSVGCNFDATINGLRNTPPPRFTGFFDYLANPIFHLMQVLGTALAVATLAGLISVLLPRQLRRARDAAMSVPASAAIVGFITMGVAIGLTLVYGLSLLLLITLLLLPVVFLIWIGLAGLLFLGWVVVSELFGRILLHRLKVYGAPMISAVVGAFVLTFSVQMLGALPCLGWVGALLSVVLGSMGVGALILTRLGMRSYPTLTVRRIQMV